MRLSRLAPLLVVGSYAQSFRPGHTPPELIWVPLNASEIESVLELLREDEANWYFVPVLGESDTPKAHPKEVTKHLAKVGSYIYGPSTIYSGHCPGFRGQDEAGLQHHKVLKDELNEKLGWMFDRVKKALKQAVAPDEIDDVWITYPYVKMHRGDTLDGLPAAIRKMALSPAPPHRDEQFKKHIDEEEQDSAHTLTFTLPLQVPTGGASLRVYDCYYDKSLRKVVDHTGRVLRQSSDYCRQSMPYEDVPYLPGRMLLFSGDQLHAVGPYTNPTSSDRRIVLQGHGIFRDGKWRLFG